MEGREIEKVALVLIDRIGSPWSWEDMPDNVRAVWMRTARAVIAAVNDAPDTVEGRIVMMDGLEVTFEVPKGSRFGGGKYRITPVA